MCGSAKQPTSLKVKQRAPHRGFVRSTVKAKSSETPREDLQKRRMQGFYGRFLPD
jgi:hypothetical protein